MRTRPFSEYNLLIIAVEDITAIDHFYAGAIRLFLGVSSQISQILTLMITSLLLIVSIITMLIIIKYYIVTPIGYLTSKIQNNDGNIEGVEKFLKEIERKAQSKQNYISYIMKQEIGTARNVSPHEFVREERGPRSSRSKLSPFNCWANCRRAWRKRKIRRMLSEINEIEQLQILYSQFFRHNSAIQKELGMYRTYEQKEIQKLLKKRIIEDDQDFNI